MKCKHCDGNGWFSATYACPVCHGTGEVQMTEPKLKPCPFCGGEARTDKLYENEWYVYCPHCERHYDTEAEAIEAWNKRVPITKDDILKSLDQTAEYLCGPTYAGDSVAVYSKKRVELNCYDRFCHEWVIQNRGKQEWQGRKLVLMNQDEIRPEILQAIISIPYTRPNETIKITTDINAGGFEGKFDCKWEMLDADGKNCFPNYMRDFNIQICVTFMEVRD